MNCRIGQSSTVLFVSPDLGREVISARDEYITGFSLFDRTSRLRLARDPSEEEILDHYKQSVLPWNAEEAKKVTSAVNKLQQRAQAFRLSFPNQVYFIKTTGNEEHGAAYTRANAIFLTEKHLRSSEDSLNWLVAHELFHVYSRHNPIVREQLYAALGYEKCNEVRLPASLRDRKISNPDAPNLDHFIRVSVHDVEYPAIPLLLSSVKAYDRRRPVSFFEYAEPKLMLLRETGKDPGRVRPLMDEKKPVLVDFDGEGVTGFFEKTGDNTGYVSHPEETAAENFVYTLFEGELIKSPYIAEDPLPSPEVLDKFRAVLHENCGDQQHKSLSRPTRNNIDGQTKKNRRSTKDHD